MRDFGESFTLVAFFTGIPHRTALLQLLKAKSEIFALISRVRSFTLIELSRRRGRQHSFDSKSNGAQFGGRSAAQLARITDARKTNAVHERLG
jgi:hypothetical protein